MNQFAFFRGIKVVDVVHETTLVKVAVGSVGALIGEHNLEALVEETHLLETSAKGFVVVVNGFKNCRIGQKFGLGTGVVDFFPLGQRGIWNTNFVRLVPQETFSGNLNLQVR